MFHYGAGSHHHNETSELSTPTGSSSALLAAAVVVDTGPAERNRATQCGPSNLTSTLRARPLWPETVFRDLPSVNRRWAVCQAPGGRWRGGARRDPLPLTSATADDGGGDDDDGSAGGYIYRATHGALFWVTTVAICQQRWLSPASVTLCHTLSKRAIGSRRHSRTRL